MSDKLLICVSSQEASAAYWRGGRLGRIHRYRADVGGMAELRDLIAGESRVPVFLMADVVEEDYRFETLPHTFGADRVQMVTRKLRQYYRNTPYAGAWPQGREAGKRRDDRYLFAALTNPDLLSEWVRVITSQELPLAGVYLLPMVSAALIDRLQVRTENLLLAVQHGAGLRLTFFQDRQFRLSRLTRGDASRSSDKARLFAGEISNTRLYLHALRTATLDEPLTVLVLDRNDELAQAAELVAQENPSVECVRVGHATLAACLRMDHRVLREGHDALYLQLMGLDHPSCSIAPPAATVGYRRYRLRRATYAACATIATVASLWAGANLWFAQRVSTQAAEVEREVAAYAARYRQLTREFPPAPATGENLKRTVEIAQALREHARDPLAVMAVISRALEVNPNLMLREFGWRHGRGEIARSDSMSGGATVTPAAARSAAPSGPRQQSAYLTGEVRGFRGDFRGAIATIEALMARLAAHPAVMEVRTVRMPLNVSPAAALSGRTDETGADAGSSEFELAIVFRPGI
jgi:hypothetical protein